MAKKWVYLFSEGNASMRNLLGGKGANLAEMTNLGMPVPQGFTISTEACTQYYEDGRRINDEIMGQIMEYIGKMEEITGKKFGDKENPLLVSVRSGARASMPGMMDTILNLGLNEEVVDVLAKKSGNPRWAWDCYRRFIQMFSDVVMEVGKKYFEELIDKMKAEKGVVPAKKVNIDLVASPIKEKEADYIKKLAGVENIDFCADKSGITGKTVSLFGGFGEIVVPLGELVDFGKEIARLEQDLEKTLSEIKRSEGLLANTGFTSKAPKALIEKEEQKLQANREKALKLQSQIDSMKD